MQNTKITITVEYYALLREERGLAKETIQTKAQTVAKLYAELQATHKFKLAIDMLRAAVNNEFCPLTQVLKQDDVVIFVPPVAGG